jgi:hypothetical protein
MQLRTGKKLDDSNNITIVNNWNCDVTVDLTLHNSLWKKTRECPKDTEITVKCSLNNKEIKISSFHGYLRFKIDSGKLLSTAVDSSNRDHIKYAIRDNTIVLMSWSPERVINAMFPGNSLANMLNGTKYKLWIGVNSMHVQQQYRDVLELCDLEMHMIDADILDIDPEKLKPVVDEILSQIIGPAIVFTSCEYTITDISESVHDFADVVKDPAWITSCKFYMKHLCHVSTNRVFSGIKDPRTAGAQGPSGVGQTFP